jgi:hypothetical protein
MAELLFDAAPALDPERLVADVQRTLPQTTLARRDDSGFTLAHEGVMGTFPDGKQRPVHTTFQRPAGRAGFALDLPRDLTQTRNWPGAAEAVSRCTTSVAIAELLERHPRATTSLDGS